MNKALIAIALGAALSACTNNALNAALKKGKSGLPAISLGNLMTITNVVISNNSSSDFEVLGAGDDPFGLCISAGATTLFGPSACKCVYNYTNPTNSAVQVQEEVDTTYVESKLVRCSTATISAAGATSVDVSVKLTAANAGSNSITVDFSGATNALDLSDATSFTQVGRYQCRDVIYIPSMFCGSGETDCMYDPIQSESTRFSYPLNFYASNLGGALVSFARKASAATGTGVGFFSKWECSMDVKNPKAFENKWIYSVGPDSAGSKVVYPPTAGAFDRATFYLARKRAGVFNVPINAFVAPGTLTSSPGVGGIQAPETFEPIGYGARPVTTAAGEICPETSTTIPSGFAWVKVWAFAGDLVPRRYVQTTQDVVSFGHVGCNPDDYSDGEFVFPDCSESGPVYRAPRLGQITNSTTGLAARIFLEAGACVEFARTQIAGGQVGAPVGASAVAADWLTDIGTQPSAAGRSLATASFPTDYPNGTDWFAKPSSDNLGTPWNLVSQADDNGSISNANITADNIWSRYDQGAAWSNTMVDTTDLDNGQSRVDYLFVVSPKTVMFDTMNNRLPGHEPYFPYTYKRTEECDSPDPASDPTCVLNAQKITTYDLWSAEITSNPDAPSQQLVYPVCALQPI